MCIDNTHKTSAGGYYLSQWDEITEHLAKYSKKKLAKFIDKQIRYNLCGYRNHQYHKLRLNGFNRSTEQFAFFDESARIKLLCYIQILHNLKVVTQDDCNFIKVIESDLIPPMILQNNMWHGCFDRDPMLCLRLTTYKKYARMFDQFLESATGKAIKNVSPEILPSMLSQLIQREKQKV